MKPRKVSDVVSLAKPIATVRTKAVFCMVSANRIHGFATNLHVEGQDNRSIIRLRKVEWNFFIRVCKNIPRWYPSETWNNICNI